MASYVLINRSHDNLHIEIPTAHSKMAITLKPSLSRDILPFVGSIEACRSLVHVYRFQKMGLIEILETP